MATQLMSLEGDLSSGYETEDLGWAQFIAAALPAIKKGVGVGVRSAKRAVHKKRQKKRTTAATNKAASLLAQKRAAELASKKKKLIIGGSAGVLVVGVTAFVLLRKKGR